MPRVILGYHGTSAYNAESILGGEPFRPSQNQYDWLGDGVYFWEYGPVRAYQWARKTYGDDTVILRARIRLAQPCLDLTDLKGTEALRRAYNAFAKIAAQSNRRLPTQRGKNRLLDRLVNFFASSTKPPVRVVRSAFIEGERLWEESGFWDHAHVQIAVRDLRLISRVELVEDPYNEAF